MCQAWKKRSNNSIYIYKIYNNVCISVWLSNGNIHIYVYICKGSAKRMEIKEREKKKERNYVETERRRFMPDKEIHLLGAWCSFVPEYHEATIVTDENIVRMSRLFCYCFNRARIHFEIFWYAKRKRDKLLRLLLNNFNVNSIKCKKKCMIGAYFCMTTSW